MDNDVIRPLEEARVRDGDNSEGGAVMMMMVRDNDMTNRTKCSAYASR